MQRLLAASLLLCLPMLAHAGDAAISTEQAKRIDDAVRAIMQVNDVPGATVLVADHGQVVYRQAYGMRDLKTRQPAAVDTTYEVGPITEQFTAAAILQLQEAGKLHLDDKLSVYLPDAPFADKVTLRQALTHSGGLPDYLAEIEDAKATGKPATFNELMGYIRDKPLRFPPGIHVEYSSTGYAMAGRVIEVVSHETYWHYLQNHLLAPAGMTHTFTVAEKNSIPGMATGYMQENDKRVPAPTIHASVGWAAGFLVTTVDDMQKWNRALQDGKIVSHADVALMSKPVETLDGFTTYGLGLTVDTLDGQSRVGHSGSSNGFVDANEYFPDQGMQIIAFTNALTRPAPAEMMTTAIFEIMHPDIAQAAMRPV
ncbi:serine hydrolase domain-containing protein, partial [Dyella sp.]|uniref:serine hydrolase domain-containing protein n=1 Tax=Dyella sp. TaxID=1869338 RepID=UPI002ED1F8FC